MPRGVQKKQQAAQLGQSNSEPQQHVPLPQSTPATTRPPPIGGEGGYVRDSNELICSRIVGGEEKKNPEIKNWATWIGVLKQQWEHEHDLAELIRLGAQAFNDLQTLFEEYVTVFKRLDRSESGKTTDEHIRLLNQVQEVEGKLAKEQVLNYQLERKIEELERKLEQGKEERAETEKEKDELREENVKFKTEFHALEQKIRIVVNAENLADAALKRAEDEIAMLRSNIHFHLKPEIERLEGEVEGKKENLTASTIIWWHYPPVEETLPSATTTQLPSEKTYGQEPTQTEKAAAKARETEEARVPKEMGDQGKVTDTQQAAIPTMKSNPARPTRDAYFEDLLESGSGGDGGSGGTDSSESDGSESSDEQEVREELVRTSAVVVHGIPTSWDLGSVAAALGDKLGERTKGAHWLLNWERRQGKRASSVVVVFHNEIDIVEELFVKLVGKSVTVVPYIYIVSTSPYPTTYAGEY